MKKKIISTKKAYEKDKRSQPNQDFCESSTISNNKDSKTSNMETTKEQKDKDNYMTPTLEEEEKTPKSLRSQLSSNKRTYPQRSLTSQKDNLQNIK